MPQHMKRRHYAEMFGPTTGDRVRLGDTSLILEVERDLIADYFQAATGAGFDYAYTFPGLNRVLQAVGRVIRSDTDRGAVLLIDARFGEARYRRLLPAWWRPVTVGRAEHLPGKVRIFWAGR